MGRTRGATAIEYVVVVGTVALACVLTFQKLSARMAHAAGEQGERVVRMQPGSGMGVAVRTAFETSGSVILRTAAASNVGVILPLKATALGALAAPALAAAPGGLWSGARRPSLDERYDRAVAEANKLPATLPYSDFDVQKIRDVEDAAFFLAAARLRHWKEYIGHRSVGEQEAAEIWTQMKPHSEVVAKLSGRVRDHLAHPLRREFGRQLAELALEERAWLHEPGSAALRDELLRFAIASDDERLRDLARTAIAPDPRLDLTPMFDHYRSSLMSAVSRAGEPGHENPALVALSEVMEANAMANDPDISRKLYGGRIDGGELKALTQRTLDQPAVAAELKKLDDDAKQSFRLLGTYDKHVQALDTDAFVYRLQLEGAQGARTLELAIAPVYVVDPVAAKVLHEKLVGKVGVLGFEALPEAERGAVLIDAAIRRAEMIDAMNAKAGRPTDYAVTFRRMKGSLDVVKRFGAVVKEVDLTLKHFPADTASLALVQFGRQFAGEKGATAVHHVFDFLEGSSGGVSVAAELLSMSALVVDVRGGKSLTAKDVLTVGGKTLHSADAFVKLGRYALGFKKLDGATHLATGLRFLKFVGPVVDGYTAAMDGWSAYEAVQRGDHLNATLDAGAATAMTANAVAGGYIAYIGVVSGPSAVTGPAAPMVMLAATATYFTLKGVKWGLSDIPEVVLLKKLGVYIPPNVVEKLK